MNANLNINLPHCVAKTQTEAQNRFLDFSLSVTTWPVSRGRVPHHYKNSHCSYVNIYISWKRKINFNSLVWKFRSIILTFLLLSNSLLFAHCCCYSKKVEIFELHFYVKSTVNYIRTVGSKQFLSTLLSPNLYVYGPFWQSNMHSTLDFCPRPARKETNILTVLIYIFCSCHSVQCCGTSWDSYWEWERESCTV